MGRKKITKGKNVKEKSATDDKIEEKPVNTVPEPEAIIQSDGLPIEVESDNNNNESMIDNCDQNQNDKLNHETDIDQNETEKCGVDKMETIIEGEEEKTLEATQLGALPDVPSDASLAALDIEKEQLLVNNPESDVQANVVLSEATHDIKEGSDVSEKGTSQDVDVKNQNQPAPVKADRAKNEKPATKRSLRIKEKRNYNESEPILVLSDHDSPPAAKPNTASLVKKRRVQKKDKTIKEENTINEPAPVANKGRKKRQVTKGKLKEKEMETPSEKKLIVEEILPTATCDSPNSLEQLSNDNQSDSNSPLATKPITASPVKKQRVQKKNKTIEEEKKINEPLPVASKGRKKRQAPKGKLKDKEMKTPSESKLIVEEILPPPPTTTECNSPSPLVQLSKDDQNDLNVPLATKPNTASPVKKRRIQKKNKAIEEGNPINNLNSEVATKANIASPVKKRRVQKKEKMVEDEKKINEPAPVASKGRKKRQVKDKEIDIPDEKKFIMEEVLTPTACSSPGSLVQLSNGGQQQETMIVKGGNLPFHPRMNLQIEHVTTIQNELYSPLATKPNIASAVKKRRVEKKEKIIEEGKKITEPLHVASKGRNKRQVTKGKLKDKKMETPSESKLIVEEMLPTTTACSNASSLVLTSNDDQEKQKNVWSESNVLLSEDGEKQLSNLNSSLNSPSKQEKPSKFTLQEWDNPFVYILPYCRVCSKVMPKVSTNWRRHYLSHNGLKPFVCDTCGKAFTSKQNLQSHQKTACKKRNNEDLGLSPEE